MKFERLLSHSSIGFWNQPMYRKKYHNFSLVKKYGISVYTLRPYRNPFQKNEFGKFVLFFQKP